MRLLKGFSLIELIITLSIIAILVIVAHHNLSVFIVKTRVDNEITKLYRLILVARNFAINNQHNVTICPLSESFVCQESWQNPITVFVDHNHNNILDINSDETIIRFKEEIHQGDALLYGKGRKKIIYQPTGNLSGLSNGTFRYCPLNHHELVRGIIIARSGRVYLSADNNGDGIEENRSRKALSCQ